MAKRRNPNQAIFFKAEIPEMPEGYYSSGPNPNLRHYVEEHAKPYDPETDDYNVSPFDKPIKTTKATAIYNMHTYWSKKPHDAIREYIKHYTKPGDIVLDPMCGSGGTALAALMEGRAAIAIDLSPAATFITKNYCTPVDVDELQAAFEELKAKVKPEIDWLYETRCDRCDGRAITAYTVYSYVFQCPRCLEKMPLFDCVEAEGETASGKPKKIKACLHCHQQGIVEEISTRQERYDSVPVLVKYLCKEGCIPQRDQRQHNDPDPKKRAYFEHYDLGKIREIEQNKIPYWYPPHRMMNVESDTEPWGDKWRAGTSNFRTVVELFTKRNLWALAILYRNISKKVDVFNFVFSSLALNASKMQQVRFNENGSIRGGGADFMKGTYYVPQIFKEINCLDHYETRFYNILKGLKEVNNISNSYLLISTQTATELDLITPDSIDYIFTDPPYAGNVQYGELNFVWEAWLDFDTRWHEKEIIVNKTRNVSDSKWESLLQKSMSECYRVLKPGRWISVCYHDTSEGTWQLMQDLMAEVGFIPESTEITLYIDTDQKSFNQLMADKVTRRDLVINFRKPTPGELTHQFTLFGDEDLSTFTQKACDIIAESLVNHPGSAADQKPLCISISRRTLVRSVCTTPIYSNNTCR
jgi:DNA modification methylase